MRSERIGPAWLYILGGMLADPDFKKVVGYVQLVICILNNFAGVDFSY